MTTPPDTLWLQQLARRISSARVIRGWTQETLADALGISIKNVQRLESGKHDLRATTLRRVADVLHVEPGSLLPHTGEEATPARTRQRSATPGPLTGLRETGWRQVRAEEDASGGRVPVYDVRPQAGGLLPSGLPTRVAWATPPEGRHLRDASLLLARLSGASMAPRLPDGAWLLMRANVPELRIRADILVYDDMAGGWLVKCVGAIEAAGDVTRVRLDSVAPGHEPRWVTLAPAGDVHVIAEVVEVLGVPG